jgi:hypothetical protein
MRALRSGSKAQAPPAWAMYEALSDPIADQARREWLDLRDGELLVGAGNVVTSRDLRILVDQAAQPIASSDAYVVAGGCDVGSAVGWSLAEGPVRPVGVVATRCRTW